MRGVGGADTPKIKPPRSAELTGNYYTIFRNIFVLTTNDAL